MNSDRPMRLQSGNSSGSSLLWRSPSMWVFVTGLLITGPGLIRGKCRSSFVVIGCYCSHSSFIFVFSKSSFSLFSCLVYPVLGVIFSPSPPFPSQHPHLDLVKHFESRAFLFSVNLAYRTCALSIFFFLMVFGHVWHFQCCYITLLLLLFCSSLFRPNQN